MRLKVLIWFWGCFLISIGQLYSQRTITGLVISADDGEPLIGVNIIIRGTTEGTVTDFDGKYELSVEANDILQFSYTGFQNEEVTVGGQSVIDVSLELSATVLDEVVISGYGIETMRRDVTGAVSKIDQATLENTAAVSVSELLQGRAAGVNIVSNDGTPGAGISINIRGLSSLSAGGAPLVVIDNIPYLSSGDDAVNPLAFLNPNDIESIDILKDASATALYGVGATNGVIVVTTKKGKKGKPRINLSTKYGVGEFARTLPTLSPQEYALYRATTVRTEGGDNNGLRNAVLYPGQPGAFEILADPEAARQYLEGQDPYQLLEGVYGVTNTSGTNWLDVITQNTVKQFYDLDFSGSTENGTSYFASVGFADEDGVIINSGFQRLSGRLNLDQKIGDMFSAGLKIQYTRTEYEGLIGDNRADNAIAQSNFLNPFINRDNVIGNSQGILNNGGQGAGPESPEYRIKNLNVSRGSDWMSSNVYLSFKPLDWLEFAVTAGLITDNFDRSYFAPSQLRESRNVNGRLDLTDSRDNRWTIQPRIAIKKNFDSGHSINGTLVFEARKETFDQLFTRYEQFNTEVLGNYSIAAAQNILSTPLFIDRRERSYLGRIQYGFRSKYILTLSTRIDQSSRFINDNTGVFPAASVAWNISEEGFLRDSRLISTLKLRGGYGVTGNNQIPVNAGLQLANISNVSYPFNNGLNTAVDPSSRFANSDITWETTEGTNVGMDIGFFKDRFTLSANYYYNKTTGLLLDVQLPAYSAFSSSIQNLGSLQNKGLEFEVQSRNIVRGNFRWSTNFNISFNRNKILDLGGQPELGFRTLGSGGSPNDVLLRVGQPIGVYYGTIQDGLINTDLERFNATPKVQDNNIGEFDYFDIDGNGLIERSEYVPIAYTLPLHTGGIGNSFSFKGFELYAFMRWSYGNDVVNNNINRAHYLRGNNNLQEGYADDIWNRQDQDRNYQKATAIFTTRINSLFSRSEFVEDGSFLRLETVKLSYALPSGPLQNIGLAGATLSVTGQNLFLLSRYSWYDPEVNGATGTNKQLFPGLDQGAYPRSRFLLFGLDVSF
ncbi:MAG: TonB-dependent receptor [Saprospiraceae bacterium]|nr:TonB-dependent receptor [Lewinella sp.]